MLYELTTNVLAFAAVFGATEQVRNETDETETYPLLLEWCHLGIVAG